MKRLIFILMSLWGTALAQDSTNIYDIRFESFYGGMIDMSAAMNKKIICAQFDAASPDSSLLLYLDSINQNSYDSLFIIVIPVSNPDTTVTPSMDSLQNYLTDTLSLSIHISAPGLCSKFSDSLQHPLLKWLSHVSLNRHFDDDILPAFCFILNSHGELYAKLDKESILNPIYLKSVLDSQQ